MTVTFDTKSPEVGWEPFLGWLREQGLDPMLVVSIEVDDDLTAMVHECATRDGKKYVIGDSVARADPRHITLTSLPPRNR